MTDRTTELLDSIAEYAARLQKADRLAQSESLAKAEDLAALYDEGSWIEEWQGIKPAKKDALGRLDPKSRNRFAGWLTWKQEQRNKPMLAPPRTYQLLGAYDVMSVLPAASRLTLSETGVTEAAIRPLSWLLKAHYEDRLPGVWQRAVELADGQSVTKQHVEEARREFKATLTPAQHRTAVATQRARTHRLKAQTAVEALWADRDLAEAEAFKQWFLIFLQEKAKAAA